MKVFLLVAMAFVSSAYSGEVQFKAPPISPEAFQQELSNETSKVAVISGAGPGGLLSALVLEKTEKFTHIIIAENREQFNRFNTLSLQDESLPALRELGILDVFKKSAIFSDQPRLFFLPWVPSSSPIQEEYSERKLPDYSADLSNIFPLTLPHHAIEIRSFQDILNQEILKHPAIFLLHGEIEIISPKNKSNRASAHFRPSLNAEYRSFLIEQPDLIVVAEGAHSRIRDELGIQFRPIEGRETEYWCSGTISMTGIIQTENFKGHISLVSNPRRKVGAFGVFRPRTQDLFLNGKALKSEFFSAEDCLVHRAYELLELERHSIEMNLPSSPDDLLAKLTKSSKFELNVRVSDRFFAYDNIILLGDSASSGSPIGGLGATLVASAYLDALKKLVENFDNTELTRESALEIYSRRAGEIISFWHSRTKIE